MQFRRANPFPRLAEEERAPSPMPASGPLIGRRAVAFSRQVEEDTLFPATAAGIPLLLHSVQKGAELIPITAPSVYFDWEKLADFPTAGGEFTASSEVAEALVGFLEPSDCPPFPIDDIFNAASNNVLDAAANDNFFAAVADSVFVPDNLRSPPDHCSLHCCAKRQRCCSSGEPQQSLCFTAEFAPAEPQQSLCFAAEFAPAEPHQSLGSAAEFVPAEPHQSLCFTAEFAPAEPPEVHYFRPIPLAERPKPLPPQYFEQTPFSEEFALDQPPKSAAGCGLSAQSAAARERRKRISDKTQELSRLIPGGGKMNTAEMLLAAHKYVRFLQAQISILRLEKFDKGRKHTHTCGAF
ncbi:Transcription factor bHLH52 [Platanthera zijinensis]|uniref:Transcription factor bHLH52 n=1 Tax=Platanthera zijinensis TaxID=2320716 RepID=A0AAP0G492_9ASPA